MCCARVCFSSAPKRRRKGQQHLSGACRLAVGSSTALSFLAGPVALCILLGYLKQGHAQGLVHPTMYGGPFRPRSGSVSVPSVIISATCITWGGHLLGYWQSSSEREEVTPTDRHLSTDVTRPRHGTDGSGLCTPFLQSPLVFLLLARTLK